MKKDKKIDDVNTFYDSISKKYTESIKRCVPRYNEMLCSLFDYLRPDFNPKEILELGCGTGNLTQLIVLKYPNAKITAVDISEESINECKSRITLGNIEYINCDFRELSFANSMFDLVLSSISIHHIEDKAKEELFRNLFLWQTPNGILSFCDQFRGESKFIYNKHIETWKAYAQEQNVSNEEWEMWMKHQQDHDYHATLSNHTKWLNEAGYSLIDCTRRFLLWTTILAEKNNYSSF